MRCNRLIVLLFLSLTVGILFQQAFCELHPHRHRHQIRRIETDTGNIVCDRCRSCSIGHGLVAVTAGDACVPCVDRVNYSSTGRRWSPCLPCSLCGAGLYVAHECNATADTVCDSCHTYRGPHNTNYRQRCTGQNGTDPLVFLSLWQDVLTLRRRLHTVQGLNFTSRVNIISETNHASISYRTLWTIFITLATLVLLFSVIFLLATPRIRLPAKFSL